MAVFEFKAELKENEKTYQMTIKVKGRKNLDLRTVGVKGVNKIVEQYFADPLDAMDFIKEIRKESQAWDDFAESIEQELDIKMTKPTIVG